MEAAACSEEGCEGRFLGRSEGFAVNHWILNFTSCRHLFLGTVRGVDGHGSIFFEAM